MDLALLWFSCAVAGVLACLLFFRASNEKNGFPPRVPGALPIIGHAIKLNHPGVYAEFQKKYGDMYRIVLSGRETVVIHDPEVIKSCLRADSEFLGLSIMAEKLLGYDREVIPYAHSDRIDTSVNALRQLIIPKMPRTDPIIVKTCVETVERKLMASESKEINIDISHLVKLIVGEITAKCLFNLTLPHEFYEDCSKLEAIQQKTYPIFSLVSIRWRFFKLLVWRSYLTNIDQIIKTYLTSHIAECRANPGRSHFVDAYVNVSTADDRSGVGKYSDDEIGHLMIGFVLASMTSTTNLTTNAIAALMKHPKYLAQVKEELNKIPQPFDTDATESGLFNGTIPTLDAVVHECARFAVVNLGSVRFALQDYDLTDATGKLLYTVPAGDLVMIPHAAKNYSENVFADATVFNPDRFLAPSSAKKSDVLNWGGGTHICPGKNLALQEARIITATLLSHYDVKPKNVEKYGSIVWQTAAGVAVSPLSGINLISIKRHDP